MNRIMRAIDEAVSGSTGRPLLVLAVTAMGLAAWVLASVLVSMP